MTVAPVVVSQAPTFLSEIFPINNSQPNLMCFRLTPEVERQDGNRLGFRFSRKFPEIVVTWHSGYFFVLAKPGQSMPSQDEWRKAILEIQEELKEDIGDRYYSIQWVRQPHATPLILAQLAIQVLKVNRPFTPVTVWAECGVKVIREPDFWAETVELPEGLKPALTLTIHSSIVSRGDLADFLENHPYRQDPEKLLIGLKVQEIERGSNCTITGIVGTVGEHREELKEKATGAISHQKLEEAPDDQPLVAVQFGKNKKQFYYPLVALRPSVTAQTSDQLQVKYGELLKATKISHSSRQQLLIEYKTEAGIALAAYGFQLGRSINSRDYPTSFWQLPVAIEQTPLLFGKGVRGIRGEVLKGLSKGGVYKRHDDYREPSRVIRIAALKLCDLKVGKFLEEIRQRLKIYGFESEIVHKKELPQLSGAEARAELEKAINELETTVNELMTVPTDIFLTFLPEIDRSADNDDGGSLYQRVYSQLLRRGIASQVIYSDTLSSVDHRQILNQVIPGILAKLGNLPFVLAEPLEIADYFIGLDISRESKEKLPGTLNACASVRLYDRQGKFIRYRLEDALIPGEEIPQRLLETLLPAVELRGKTVLIYRDGFFCGQEVEHLLEWARAINSKFILVECKKSGIPRLYNLNEQKIVTSPKKGLALRLSSREAVLVTTKVSDRVGLARPLRLTVHEEGHQVSIESVLETTLKLTLLHHGALQTPRLPMPLYGADRMAYLRLNGIYPTSMLSGDRQFWL
ncbi:stem cell self-renewal protein Piwi [Scytonema hofmannii PCC 7110]|uniref:Protein argonaute n=1 Tax=Scytonema hofmannii PCC 7110 TaxID=128403 RepID=A0A139XGN8_9CYAN|nr:Piwi domain-containing protein [Scytonema hofmannii]KYC43857.1 stem cell self-renewal protein Piwi [Scytonema hofmannii PCC 7110]